MNQSYDEYLDNQLLNQEIEDEEFSEFYNNWIDNPDGYEISVSISRPNFDDDYVIDVSDAKTKEAIMRSLDKTYGKKLSEFYSDRLYLSDLEDRADYEMVKEAERNEETIHDLSYTKDADVRKMSEGRHE